MISRRTIMWMFVFCLITSVCPNTSMRANNLADAARLAQLHITHTDSVLIDDPVKLVEQGREAFEEGYYEEALPYFQKAAEGFQKANRRPEEVNTRIWIIVSYFSQYRYPEALNVAEQTAEIARNIKYFLGEGICLKWMGDIYRRQGLLIKALEAYKAAHPPLKGAPQDEITVIVGRGNTYADLGQYRNAVESYESALNILHDDDKPISYKKQLKAETLRDYGTALMRLGQNDDALENSQQALKIFQELHDQSNIATVLTAIGGIYEELGRQKRNSGYYLKAREKYRKALEIQRELGFLWDEGITLNNIGKVLDRWGWDAKTPALHKQALEYYHDALEKLQGIEAKDLKGRTLNNIGEAYIHLSFYENTSQHLEEALRMLKEAQKIQESIHDRAHKWITLSNLGWCYKLQGDIQEAIDSSKTAIEIFEEIVRQAGINKFKISLREQADAAYQRLVLLFTASGQFEQAFNVSEQARARVFLDQLGNANIVCTTDEELLQQKQRLRLELADIEQRLSEQYEKQREQSDHALVASLEQQRTNKRDYYKELLRKIELSCPEYASMIGVSPRKLSDVQAHLKRLESKAALLSYFVTPEKTAAFIISENSFKAIELPIRRDTLEAAVRRFHDHLEPDNPHPESLQTLYQQLIAPLNPYLPTKGLIGMIPHDALHYVPFAALTDGQQYLCEKYALFSLPSASVLKFVLDKRKIVGRNILAMANSSVIGAAPLSFAVKEVQAIAKQYKNTTVLISDEKTKKATEAKFKESAEKYSILHLSAHGQLDTQDPLSSRIYLTPGDGEDGKLEVHEVYELSLENADLVVLSACETNLGQRSRGDDIIGLTRSFIYAETPSVIATLWKVNDYAAKELMVAFYKHLKRKSKAEALRAAQQEIRKKFPQPRHWAGFVLTGDPGE